MNTAYKTRAWYLSQILDFAADCFGAECAQTQLWCKQMNECWDAFNAPSDDPRRVIANPAEYAASNEGFPFECSFETAPIIETCWDSDTLPY